MDLWLLVFLLVVVQPLVGYYRFTRVAARRGPIGTAAKLRLYALVVVTQWTLVLAASWVLARRDLAVADLGLAGAPPVWAVLAALLVTAGLLGGTWLSLRALAREPGEPLPSHLRRVVRILPAGAGERVGFAAVALTAGVCEEILYRGLLIFAFDQVLPSSYWSLAAAALLFGTAHAYQGPRGVAATGLLGGFLGLLYVWSGSLWPGVGLHFAVDLVNGYALGPLERRRAVAGGAAAAFDGTAPPPAYSASEESRIGPAASEEPQLSHHPTGVPAAQPRRPLDEYRDLPEAELHERIAAAKARLGPRLVILGHHYQRDEVIRHADFTGDSYRLSRLAAETPAEFIVFCGVHFMAESADVLAQPHQRVILPDLGAGCSMADMADAGDVEEAWAALGEVYDTEVLPLTYMNSTAAIKAFCGRAGGLVCTSSNAQAAFRWAWERKRTILFLPDEHLGRNTGAALGVPLERMSLWDPRPAPEIARRGLAADSPLVLWKGYCSVHQRFTAAQVDHVRRQHPGLRVIVHPECPYEVCRKADEVGSTDYIIRTVGGSPPGSKWAVGTEIHLVHRLAQQHPDKLVVSLQTNVCACATMYRIDPPHLCWALENLVDGAVVNEIRVDEDTVRWARLALERMLEVGTDAQRIARD